MTLVWYLVDIHTRLFKNSHTVLRIFTYCLGPLGPLSFPWVIMSQPSWIVQKIIMISLLIGYKTLFMLVLVTLPIS